MTRWHLPLDIWCRFHEDRAQVSNIRTGRRALLNEEEMVELETFAPGRPLDPESELHRRFLDADLVVSPEAPLENPRLESLLKAIDRFLTRRLDLRRRDLSERFPDPASKFDKVRELAGRDIETNRAGALHSTAVATRDLTVMLDHVLTYSLEESTGDQTFRFKQGFLSRTLGRPLPREDYEQQPCMPETSQRRVEMAKSMLPPQSRGLILGDDDLLSVYWNDHLNNPCDVFELDDELLDFLRPRLNEPHRLLARDLTQGLPREYHGLYDLIFTDPMYERKGMDLFMRCCRQGLSDNPAARVLFTTRPDMIEAGHLFQERLAEAGLAIELRLENFSRYRLPNFYRRKLVRGFHGSGVSPQLVQGLAQIPYLYADMFVLKAI